MSPGNLLQKVSMFAFIKVPFLSPEADNPVALQVRQVRQKTGLGIKGTVLGNKVEKERQGQDS